MWCPKCKNEYREGITVCADCKVDLVEFLDETEEDTELLHAFAEEEDAKRLVSYLEYSGISSHYEPMEEENCFGVFLEKKKMKQAKKAFAAFLTVETEKRLESIIDGTAAATKEESAAEELAFEEREGEEETKDDQEEIMEEIHSALSSAKQGSYVSKAEKSADYRSSAFTFLFFGIAGLIVMGLHWAGVFQYFSTFSSILITILFLGFLVVGIDSFSRAKKARAESEEEERFIEQLKEWLEQNLTYDMLLAADQNELSKEANFLNEISEMKKIIQKQFGELDPAFLDHFTEEYYNEHFEGI